MKRNNRLHLATTVALLILPGFVVSSFAQGDNLVREAAIRQANATKYSGPDGELLLNGSFQSDQNVDGVPDGWGTVNAPISWAVEADNRFLRLKAPEPDKTVLFYRLVDIPTGAKALQFSWKQRISDLKPGINSWYDARIMLDFKAPNGDKMPGGPAAPDSRTNTQGWEEKSIRFLVPEGALSLELMPSLLQVDAGTFDLDDLSLKPIDAAPLLAQKAKDEAEERYANLAPEAPNKAKWPLELHVVGNKVLDINNREIWLRGVNVPSLEWSPRGERPLRSIQVAIDDWKSNTIRLPINDKYWFGRDLEQKDGGASYREIVDNAITIAANRGAYVLLDLHHYRAPRQTDLLFWKEAAAKYKNHPAVLFDVFNEPHDISWKVWRDGGFVADKLAPADEDAFLTPEEKVLNAKGFHSVGIQALIDAARATGARNIIVAGALDWAYDLSGIAQGYALNDRGGHGIIYASHIYAAKRNWKSNVLAVADKYPIILSEFGAIEQKFGFIPAEEQEDAATWVPKIFGFIDKYKLHYTGFAFHPSADPRMLEGWDYTPNPEWGALIKRALAGEKFPFQGMR